MFCKHDQRAHLCGQVPHKTSVVDIRFYRRLVASVKEYGSHCIAFLHSCWYAIYVDQERIKILEEENGMAAHVRACVIVAQWRNGQSDSDVSHYGGWEDVWRLRYAINLSSTVLPPSSVSTLKPASDAFFQYESYKQYRSCQVTPPASPKWSRGLNLQ